MKISILLPYKENFTKGRTWTLAYKNCYKTKSHAMKNEYILKNDKKKRKIIKDKFLDKN